MTAPSKVALDFAGLLALISENHFLALGIEQVGGERMLAVRQRSAEGQPETGELIVSAPLAHRGEIELSLAIDRGTADLAWRPAGAGSRRTRSRVSGSSWTPSR